MKREYGNSLPSTIRDETMTKQLTERLNSVYTVFDGTLTSPDDHVMYTGCCPCMYAYVRFRGSFTATICVILVLCPFPFPRCVSMMYTQHSECLHVHVQRSQYVNLRRLQSHWRSAGVSTLDHMFCYMSYSKTPCPSVF